MHKAGGFNGISQLVASKMFSFVCLEGGVGANDVVYRIIPFISSDVI